MKKIFWTWIFKPAKPWQFWLPMSGLPGGAVFGAVVSYVLWRIIFNGP